MNLQRRKQASQLKLVNEMSTPGVEPGLSRPRRDVLTTRRCGQLDENQLAQTLQCRQIATTQTQRKLKARMCYTHPLQK